MAAVQPNELADTHSYNAICFRLDSIRFFHEALKYYKTLIDRGLELLSTNADLSVLLPNARERVAAHRDIHLLSWTLERFEKELPQDPRENDWAPRTISLSHEIVRFVKSVALLYLKHLEQRRDRAATAGVPGVILQEIDSELARTREKISMGVFSNASPMQLLYLESEKPERVAQERDEAGELPTPVGQRPIVAGSIQIFDPELRKRCMDLFNQFREDGAHERLDTCIAEATKILEVRIRELAGLPESVFGAQVAGKAFGGQDPPLRVSNHESEQEGAQSMFRGAFGFLRNPSAHKLLGKLNPDRVLQILGWVDHLIHVAENAQRKTEAEKGATPATGTNVPSS